MTDAPKRGPGRPRTREKHAPAVRAAEKKIVDRLPEIVDAQIELALGIMVEQVDKDTGRMIVYAVAPDGKAGQYLINRILGSPQTKVDVDHAGGINITVSYADTDD